LAELTADSGQALTEGDKSLTVRETAAALGLSSRTVRRLISRGDLRASKRGGKFQIDSKDLALVQDVQAGHASPAPRLLRLVPSSPSAPAVTSRVPVPPSRLIGRQREVAAFQKLLRSPDGPRLLVLTGPGGVGKTRLAMEIASAATNDFADGVVFISLASIRDPALVTATIAKAVGVRERGDGSLEEQIAARLAAKRLLLVLDNFEHLVAAGPVVAELLASCPRLTCLVTSRDRLRLSGEHVFPVSPLALPGVEESRSGGVEEETEERGRRRQAGDGRQEIEGSAAVQLFVARAQAVDPGFILTQESAGAVAEICRRLDGLPLAIELAAARIAVLPPSALLARLYRRLPLLTGGARDLPARLQTMRDTIAWTYDLLSAEEQSRFRHLSVFIGEFMLEAAETVCHSETGVALVEGVSSLLDHSLLQGADGPGGEARFQMLETIREYGFERLAECGEEAAVRDAHAAHFLALAATAEFELQGAAQVAWLERLEVEHDNLRAALSWLSARDMVEDALRLAGSLWFFRWLRGYYAEGRAQSEALLALPSAARRTVGRAKALNGLGVIALSQGDTARAVAAHEEALAITRELGDEPGAAFSLVCLGAPLLTQAKYDRGVTVTTESLELCRGRGDDAGANMALALLAYAASVQGDHEREEALFTESVAMGRARGERWGTALDLNNLGWQALERGDDQRACELFNECLAMVGELGDKRGQADTLNGLGRVYQHQGDLARSIGCYEESLTLARETGDQQYMARALFCLGHAAWRQGDKDRAGGLIRQALALYHPMGDLLNVAASVEALAVLAGASGGATQAARLIGAAARLIEQVKAPIPRYDRFDHGRVAARTRDVLGPGAFAAAWEAGQALTLEQAVSEAAVATITIRAATGAAAEATGEANSARVAAFGLTARELEILHLLARRATDLEIADLLSISPRTVMHHVSHVLAKLGSANRREAAAWAGSHGIA
jgi:excisionase family DNA binding protein